MIRALYEVKYVEGLLGDDMESTRTEPAGVLVGDGKSDPRAAGSVSSDDGTRRKLLSSPFYLSKSEIEGLLDSYVAQCGVADISEDHFVIYCTVGWQFSRDQKADTDRTMLNHRRSGVAVWRQRQDDARDQRFRAGREEKAAETGHRQLPGIV